MRKLIALFVAMAFILVAVASPAAVAQENAGEDEYTEGVPGGGGETPSGEPGAGSGSGSPLPPSIAGQFEGAGADGAAAAALAEQLDSGAAGSDDSRGQNGAAGEGPGTSASDSSGTAGNASTEGGLSTAVGEILDSDSDSGMGIWLPIILGLALLTALVAGLARFRNSRTAA